MTAGMWGFFTVLAGLAVILLVVALVSMHPGTEHAGAVTQSDLDAFCQHAGGVRLVVPDGATHGSTQPGYLVWCVSGREGEVR